MKILIIGSGGMLGHLLTIYLGQNYDVMDISRKRKCRPQSVILDVLNCDCLNKFFYNHQFDLIINCAAILTEACLKDKAEAILLNSYFPHYLEEKFIDSSTKIIQVSTGGVFSGQRGLYSETDLCDTESFYGRTKLLGEINNCKDLTIRSDFIGPDMSVNSSGLFNWIMNSSGTIRGYNKAYFNGVTSLEFAKFVENSITNKWSGIYHLCTNDINSKADFARYVCYVFKKDLNIENYELVKYNTSLVTTRNDIDYSKKTLYELLTELKEWVYSNTDIYQHYFEKR